MITVIFDVHGKVDAYKKITEQHERTICLGDFGFKNQWDWHTENINPDKHKILMGNHDYIPYVNSHKASLGDWAWLEEEGIFLVRGALSIDKHLRTEGLDYFSDEELTYKQLEELIDIYIDKKPEIVITHEGPKQATSFFNYTRNHKSVTDQFLTSCFMFHQPKKWLFGHHHKNLNIQIGKTEFICREELGYQTIYF
jgi:hypothetical protein